MGDEQDRYTIRFKTVSIAAVPIVEVFKPSMQASAPYMVWWNNLSANRWNRNAEYVFRVIFAKGKAKLNQEEDQIVLKEVNILEPAITVQKLKQKATKASKVYKTS